MWTNAQRDGRPAEYRWHPLSNATMPCSNTAKMQNLLKLVGVLQTRHIAQSLVGRSSPYCGRHVEDILLFNKFYSDCRYVP